MKAWSGKPRWGDLPMRLWDFGRLVDDFILVMSLSRDDSRVGVSFSLSIIIWSAWSPLFVQLPWLLNVFFFTLLTDLYRIQGSFICWSAFTNLCGMWSSIISLYLLLYLPQFVSILLLLRSSIQWNRSYCWVLHIVAFGVYIFLASIVTQF